MPVLLTSKPHETPWNISETLKNLRKVSKRATKPLENGFSLNFDQFPWIFRCTKTKNKASVYFITQIQPKNANIVLNNEKKESQQHPVFPGLQNQSRYYTLILRLVNGSSLTREKTRVKALNYLQKWKLYQWSKCPMIQTPSVLQNIQRAVLWTTPLNSFSSVDSFW